MSEEDLQDAAPLLLGHSLPEQLVLTHLSHIKAQSPAHTEVLQILHEGASLFLGVKQHHLVGGRLKLLVQPPLRGSWVGGWRKKLSPIPSRLGPGERLKGDQRESVVGLGTSERSGSSQHQPLQLSSVAEDGVAGEDLP